MKVIVGGPPQSGKSTFTAALIRSIRERGRDRSFHVSFSWQPLDVTDNSIATLLNPDADIEQKRDVDWTDERADERRAIFEARDEQLVVADAPGRVTSQLEIVTEPADAIIILANDDAEDEIDDWREFVEESDLDVFAELTSVLDEDAEIGWDVRNERKGTIQGTSRDDFEEDQLHSYGDTTRRMIRQVASDLLKECS